MQCLLPETSKMQVTFRENGRVARLALPLRFVFSEHPVFRQMLAKARSEPSVAMLELDFSRVEYLDSAALGMLRCLIDAETRLVIRLLNPCQTVRELLEMAELQAV